MSLKYLLDTNIVSGTAEEPVRLVPSFVDLPATREKPPSPRSFGTNCSSDVRAFLCRVVSRRDRTLLGDVVLASFPILDYDRAAARWHARERVRLEAAGKTPPFVDGQIAAIACVNDLVLVTANKVDFRGFKGLRVEGWI